MKDEYGTDEERVARGSAWLDENYPEWEKRIDVGQLDIASTRTCVLGQLDGFEEMSVRHSRVDNEECWLGTCGFAGAPFESLTTLWRSHIRAKQNLEVKEEMLV